MFTNQSIITKSGILLYKSDTKFIKDGSYYGVIRITPTLQSDATEWCVR